MELADESDFSLSEEEETDETIEKPLDISASTLEHLNKATVKINVGRLSPDKLRYHMKILQVYLMIKKLHPRPNNLFLDIPGRLAGI